MAPKILIVTSSIDLTSDYLISTYHQIDFIRLNVDKFSEYEILVNENIVKIKNSNWEYCLDDIDSIYYRKPILPNLNSIIDSQYHTFMHKEIFSFIEGIIESFPRTCISKPSILRKANNKIVQCLTAKNIGFKIPISRITNSDKWALSPNGCTNIVKPISIGTIEKDNSKIFVQTNIVDKNIHMDTLKYCPSYFQDYIEKEYEVRITFIGDNNFPVKIISSDKVDWRKKDNFVTYETIDTPKEILDKCKKMLSAFNLSFGCFDFAIKNDEYYFLEVNANGQWLWLENELGINISESIIQELS